MSLLDAVFEVIGEGVSAVVRFFRDLPRLPAKLREARRRERLAKERAAAEAEAARREAEARQAVVGRRGVVVRPLKQSGLVEVDGQTYDAMSESGFVEVGAAVTVIAWDGHACRVRRADAAGTG